MATKNQTETNAQESVDKSTGEINNAVSAADKFRQKIVGKTKQVTLPLLKTEENKPVFVRIVKAKFQSEKIDTGKKDDGMEPAIMVIVFDFLTNQFAQMILNKVVEGELDKKYPDAGYVGRNFEITKLRPPKEGKRYFIANILEFETPDGVTIPEYK